MDLILVGVNHNTTPIELREKLAFSDVDATGFLGGLAADSRVAESLLLSTCNRTELYTRLSQNGSGPEDPAAFLRETLVRGRAEGLSPSHFYIVGGRDAVRHIFRVAAGLDSMIMGEAQILGQVRDAYKLAGECRTNGFLINKVMHAALRVGRRARTETEIGIGAVSVSMAAVELSQKIFRDIGRKTALVAGAGEMAALTAEHFVSKGIGRLVFTNRTMEKAEALAKKYSGSTAPWGNLVPALAAADITVVSTRSPEYLVTADMVRSAMHARRNRPIFLIDIAVPRNIDPAAAKIYNVFAHNIDGLKQIIDRNLSRRRAEVPRVERIIEEELRGFDAWLGSLAATPTIKALLNRAEEIRAAEVEKSARHFTREQREKLDAVTRGIIKKILHAPITRIKETDEGTEDALYRIEAVRDIFGLRESGCEAKDNNSDEEE